MRRPLPPDSPGRQIVDEEQRLLARVHALLARAAVTPVSAATDYAAELLALRDQISDERLEDLPSLVEQMTRIQALARGRRGKAALGVDASSPYFAHLRLAADEEGTGSRDVLIGRRGLIDRAAGVQIVDWRDAPISQIYYRYEEGDDYDEEVGAGALRGVVLKRRNLVISAGALRRIGCPQGAFVASDAGEWFEQDAETEVLLEGGQGTAARPPRRTPRRRGQRASEVARARATGSKQLPEIAALIDREQFALIVEPASGLVVIQGGAGSGKTTVALHRIAYLVFHEPSVFRPSRCMVVVPSEALARYVGDVLPALGVPGVPVVTFRSWARGLRKRLVHDAPDRYADETPPSVTRLKKHPALIDLLTGAALAEVASARVLLVDRLAGAPGADWILTAWDDRAELPPLERARQLDTRLGTLDVPAPTKHRAEQALKIVRARLRGTRRVLAELLTDRARLAPLAAAAREPATAQELDELASWSSAQLDDPTPEELEGIDAERMAAVDGRPLDDGAPDANAHGRIDLEDDALLLRLHQLLQGGFRRVDGAPLVYDHIAIDEAQDLSALEIKVLFEATTPRRSITIAGDVAQRVVFDNGFTGWSDLLTDAGLAGGARVRPLKLAYRSTAEVMRFAAAVLGPLADPEAELSARPGAPVALHRFEGMGEAVAFVSEALRSLLGREPSSSVALITRHAGQADAWHAALERAEVPMLRRVRRQDFAFAPGVDVTDVLQVKGLEFDYVILLDVNQSSYPVTVEARHLLHIGATRAAHQLWVISTGAPSLLLADVEGQAKTPELMTTSNAAEAETAAAEAAEAEAAEETGFG